MALSSSASSSSSVIGSQPDIKHKHVCKIENFSEKMQMEHGTKLESGVFTIKIGDKTTRWCLRIFPNGDPMDNSFAELLT